MRRKCNFRTQRAQYLGSSNGDLGELFWCVSVWCSGAQSNTKFGSHSLDSVSSTLNAWQNTFFLLITYAFVFDIAMKHSKMQKISLKYKCANLLLSPMNTVICRANESVPFRRVKVSRTSWSLCCVNIIISA
jgi:hypothetical protein